MTEEFDNWFDSAVATEIFKLTAPSAQYRAAKAAWKAARGENAVPKEPVSDPMFTAPTLGTYEISGKLVDLKKGEEYPMAPNETSLPPSRRYVGKTVLPEGFGNVDFGDKDFTITSPSIKLEQTTAKVKDDPTQRHLTGYLRGQVKDGWETFIIRGTYFARYSKYLTEDEINKAIISMDEQAIIAERWKDKYRKDTDHNGIFHIPDPDE